MDLTRYSIGTGDHFGQQGKAQLAAVMNAWERGVELGIVWNKSHREHVIVNSDQHAVRLEAGDRKPV